MTEVDFTIRGATLNDVQLLQEVGLKAFVDTFGPYNTAANMNAYVAEHYTTSRITKEINTPANEFILIFDSDVCAGYAKLREGETPNGLSGSSIEIERLYAVQEYIGKKVGQTLMNACVDRARKKGFETVWLGVWEKNERAKKFYSNNGFEKFGDHAFMLGDDEQTDWLMKKEI